MLGVPVSLRVVTVLNGVHDLPLEKALVAPRVSLADLRHGLDNVVQVLAGQVGVERKK